MSNEISEQIDKKWARLQNRLSVAEAEGTQDSVTVKAVCTCCNGTGLYKGSAERNECAVLCRYCGGTGCVEITYEPFVKRKVLPAGKVVRVFLRSGGYMHFPHDTNDVRFSQGGCTYEEFLNGCEPRPVKDMYCPYAWVNGHNLPQDNVQIESLKTRCGKKLCFPYYCGHHADKEECWRIYESYSWTEEQEIPPSAFTDDEN